MTSTNYSSMNAGTFILDCSTKRNQIITNLNDNHPLIGLDCSNTQTANKFNEHFSQVAQSLLDCMPQPAGCDKNYISYLGKQECS